MRTPKERLAHLLDLAAQPGARAELVRELADILTAWPVDYPVETRSAFAALLSRVEHDVDPEQRRALAVTLAECSDAPLSLLNEFFFDVPEAARHTILARDAQLGGESGSGVDEAALISAARGKRGSEFAGAFADAFGIDALTAMEILQDANGMVVAIACRGAGISRATYSALVILAARGDAEARLAMFDTVPEKGASAMLAFWRKQAHAHASQPRVAA
jgi:uncharacterized protein (DUF2336 family)